ncbi:MAG: DUF4190 domain-containing protein [Clostridiales bacterium]|nr:DUF4190 domain-containing protein [Clostridiales bacterium]
MPEHNHRTMSVYHMLSLSSLLCGILGLICIFYPPAGLVLGVSAILTAWLSKNDRRRSASALAGTVLGCLAAALSLLIFMQYVLVIDYITDPGNSALVTDILQKYRDLFGASPVQ